MLTIRFFKNFAERASRKIFREVRDAINRTRYQFQSTYVTGVSSPHRGLVSQFAFLDAKFIERLASEFPKYPELVLQQSEQAMAHCFDLLGSGPVVVAHGLHCRGLEGIAYSQTPRVTNFRHGDWLEGRINSANLATAKRINSLIDVSYTSIDWHIDFKSGYRWREDTWYRDIRFGHLPGVDVKVPWELSRMQHLPTLGMACHFARAGVAGFRSADAYAKEFRNLVLDFVSTNPPGFGVNWACAMDVAIRLVNLLVARDIIVTSETPLDREFEEIFSSMVVAHAQHIASNLEWSPKFRGNHYIANIVGLLFAALYLPCGKDADAWLALSVQELIAEMDFQFHEDGSNFEASTCYHRLSSEMMLWASALLLNLSPEKRIALRCRNFKKIRTTPKLKQGPVKFYPLLGMEHESPLPDWFWLRLERMACFTDALTRPDNMVTQFGDNDSGRFLMLGSGEQIRAKNNPAAPAWSLDHSALIAGIRTIISRKTHGVALIQDPCCHFLRGIAAGKKILISGEMKNQPFVAPLNDDKVWEEVLKHFTDSNSRSRWTCEFNAGEAGLLTGVSQMQFVGMGCYVIKSPRLYLAIRCGELGLSGLGAHAHCDQLAIDLVIDGVNYARDPGTYLYTPLPKLRNIYRSARAHHVPRIAEREPADLNRGVFELRGGAEGECLYFGPKGFIGRHAGYGGWVYRIIELEDKCVRIHDFSPGNLPITDPTPESIPFSQGYGYVAK